MLVGKDKERIGRVAVMRIGNEVGKEVKIATTLPEYTQSNQGI
jgi:hypothetical protein